MESQEQRAAEQAQRDQQIKEANKIYTTFNELPLEIVVDVRSFTISVLPEPEEIVLSDFPVKEKQQPTMATPSISRRPAAKSYRDPNKVSKVGATGKKSPVLVVPEPNASTKLKTPYLQNTRAINRLPMSNRKQVKLRQNGIFKCFTLLVVSFFKERFVWARRKPDTTNADHDRRMAENYVFDEVLDVNVPRSEFDNALNLTVMKSNNEQSSMTTSQHRMRSDVFQVVRKENNTKHIMFWTIPKLHR